MIIIISRFKAFHKRLNASMCFRPLVFVSVLYGSYLPSCRVLHSSFPLSSFSIEKGCLCTPSNRKNGNFFLFFMDFPVFENLKINISILTRFKAFGKCLNASTCFSLLCFRFRPAWLSIAVLSLCN